MKPAATQDQIDRIVRAIISAWRQAGAMPTPVYDHLATEVHRECQDRGLSVSKSLLDKRVNAAIWGEDEAEEKVLH